MVPSSEPDAYDSPPGANRTVCTGPWCPAALEGIQVIHWISVVGVAILEVEDSYHNMSGETAVMD